MNAGEIMWEALLNALKNGKKSSEFWLSLLAIALPVVDSAAQAIIDALTSAQATAATPLRTIVLAGAAAFVSAAYSIARAMVKREQIRQLPTTAALETVEAERRTTPTGLG